MGRRALVVTSDLDRGTRWIGWLHAAGYHTSGCVGPELTHGCPRARGGVCHQRDQADVVVVDASSDPRAICAAAVAGRAFVVAPDDPAAGERRGFLARVAAQPPRRRS